jgi:hypothetical protein
MCTLLRIHPPGPRHLLAVGARRLRWMAAGAVLVLSLYGCGTTPQQSRPVYGAPGSPAYSSVCPADPMYLGGSGSCQAGYSPWACRGPYGCANGNSPEDTLRSVAGALQSLDSASRSAWSIQQTWR